MIARRERPADRLDQLRRRGSGRRRRCAGAGSSTANSAPAIRATRRAPAVGPTVPLDPPRHRLQHRIAGGAAEGGVDRVVAADRDEQDDERRLACSAPAARRARPAPRGRRAARSADRAPRPRRWIGSARPTTSPPSCRRTWWAIRRPALAMGEGGRLAGGEQPVDRVARRAAALGIELAEQVHQADPPPLLLAEPGLAGERRAELDGARARLPAPGGGVRLLAGAARRCAAPPPTRSAWRRANCSACRNCGSVNGLTRKWVAPC